jgi:LmbE family N-acetylglucosaminyl deacetylase
VRRAAVLALAFLSFVAAPRLATAQSADRERGAAALGEVLRGLGVTTRVLVIGAHPDDEDTQLITWLARGRGVETGYLSLTRGDGGQNLIGNELGEALGVIRTEELLAARRIDGGRQFFTRAYDFGFSKSAEETYRHWPKDSLLRDVVTVVRGFRPHVIVSIFSGTPRDGHGHHQVAGLLAREAYDLAGDSVRFPRAQFGPPWTPLKFYRSSRFAPDSATLRFNVGEFNPMLGRSYAEIAGESRSQHKSQGFGSLERKGVIWDYLRREATRVNASQAATTERSLFDGIDTSLVGLKRETQDARHWATIDSLARSIAAAQRTPYWTDPSAVAPHLATIARQATMPLIDSASRDRRPGGARGPVPDALREALGLITVRALRGLRLASGVSVEAETEQELFGFGERSRDSVRLRVTIYNRGRAPVVATPSIVGRGFDCATRPADGDTVSATNGRRADGDSSAAIQPDSARAWSFWLCAASTGEPGWLRSPRAGDLFATRAGVPPNDDRARPGDVSALVWLETLGPRRFGLPFAAAPVRRVADPVRGEIRRPVTHVPTISVLLDRSVELAPANMPVDRMLRVQLRSAARVPREVTLSLRGPDGLTTDSATRTITLPPGGTTTISFRLRGRLPAGTHRVAASAESGGERFAVGYATIDYDHIRPRRLYRRATTDIVAADVVVPTGLAVAYLPGVSDNVAPAIEQLGIPVSVIGAGAVALLDPQRTPVLVIGPRAYEANDTLMANAGPVLEFARRGGTVVAQYGQHEMMQQGVLPYPISVERRADRVTEEDAPVRFVDPASPLLTYPNRITERDFAGWVQERALYMPRTFDARYHAPLSMNDPGEPPNQGAILVAPVGRGTFVYTTLAFFRQLPAGHPGAARLFVNLLAAGRRPANR